VDTFRSMSRREYSRIPRPEWHGKSTCSECCADCWSRPAHCHRKRPRYHPRLGASSVHRLHEPIFSLLSHLRLTETSPFSEDLRLRARIWIIGSSRYRPVGHRDTSISRRPTSGGWKQRLLACLIMNPSWISGRADGRHRPRCASRAVGPAF